MLAEVAAEQESENADRPKRQAAEKASERVSTDADDPMGRSGTQPAASVKPPGATDAGNAHTC